MWPCAPCGTANEPHAIFCAACGATRYKAPNRETAPALEPAPLPSPSLPEFRGTAAGFSVAWGLATLGGALGASVVESFLSFFLRFGGSPDSWEFTLRMAAFGVAKGFVYGVSVGGLQSWVLRRRAPRPGWSGWILATLGGTVVVFLAGHLVPFKFWSDSSGGRVATTALMGVIGGGFIGLLQSRVLARAMGPGAWSAWWLLSAAAQAIGNVAGHLAWEWTFDSRHYGFGALFLAGLSYTVVDAGLVALLTGIPLARMLRRRCAPQDLEAPRRG